MGRSQLQGTPWHYEYLNNKKSKRNSINCIYNTGRKCACTFSNNYGKQCIGEKNCSDFERCSFSRPSVYKAVGKTKNTNLTKKKTETAKKYNPKKTVEKGNWIVVSDVKAKENISIHVTDPQNPFYKKCLNEIVLIKCEQYKIVEIRKNK